MVVTDFQSCLVRAKHLWPAWCITASQCSCSPQPWGKSLWVSINSAAKSEHKSHIMCYVSCMACSWWRACSHLRSALVLTHSTRRLLPLGCVFQYSLMAAAICLPLPTPAPSPRKKPARAPQARQADRQQAGNRRKQQPLIAKKATQVAKLVTSTAAGNMFLAPQARTVLMCMPRLPSWLHLYTAHMPTHGRVLKISGPIL